VLGVVNFPSFHDAMASAQHIVKLGPTAVELVDRTMIELALANPAFKPTMQTALIGQPEAILLVEFAGDDRAVLLAQLQRLVELMGDLGLPAAWSRCPTRPRRRPVGGAQGRPEHHDEPEGRRQAGQLHRGLRGAAAAPGRLHRRADRGLRAPRHARHLVRPRVGGHAARAAHPRHARERRVREDARHRRGSGRAGAQVQGRLQRRAWRRPVPRRVDRVAVRPRLNDAFRAIKAELDPAGLFNPGKIVDPPKMDDGALFRFPPPDAPRPYRRIPLTPVLDWSAWNVQADPVTEATTAPGTGGDSTGGFAKAVEMCNNNGHCRKFDAGTMCPATASRATSST
jgi:FAD/FMN-containing dehydrogenase